MVACKLISQSCELVNLSLQQQFPKLYSFWSVWDVDLCLQSEQPNLPCYCSHNELVNISVCIPIIWGVSVSLCPKWVSFNDMMFASWSMWSFFISSIFLLKFLIFICSNLTPPGTSWNRYDGIYGKMFFLSLFISFSTCSETHIWFCV